MDSTSTLYVIGAVVVACLAATLVARYRARKKGRESGSDIGRAFRALIAIVVLGGSTFFTLTADPNLGLDLRGGAQIVLETQDTDTVEANSESTDQAVGVLRRRVDALGVSEPSLTRSGDRRIIVELPGVEDPREASESLGQTAQLTIHRVLGYGNQQGQPTPPGGEGEGNQQQPPPDSTDAPQSDPNEGAAGGNAQPPSPEGDTGTDAPGNTETPGEGGEQTLPDESGQPLRLGPTEMTGEEIDGSEGVLEPQQGWLVNIDFSGSGGDTWASLTADAACQPPNDPTRRIAIVLDGEIISSPNVQESVACDVGIRGGQTTITGDFDETEAQDLAALIEGGALPVPVEVIEQRVVGPTLGDEAIEASAWAAIIGMALTTAFIAITYRLVGVMAVLALLGYGLLSFASLTALGATLTLPGLAGFVLAIGMAVDANVLIFERAREDYVDGRTKSLRGAVKSGFKKALSAIADSNITTLLAAGLLFFLASGPVRGFGVTLSLGVIASMLSALVVSRTFSEWLVDRRWVQKHPMASGLGRHGRVRLWLRSKDVNLMRYARRWLTVSAVAVVVALVGIGVRGLDFGIEFTGGRMLEVSTAEQVDIDDAREVVADAGFPTAVVQESGEDNISVRAGEMSDDESATVQEALDELGGGSEIIRDSLIGPSLGEELQRNALIALGVALTAQLAYLAFRFRWTLGTGAVVALFQNVIVVVGTFAWLGKSIDGIFLAALLTVIGYTVNDSVVVFDRIRESWTRQEGEDFSRVANTAVFNTLPRSVNTGISTLFVLLALLFLGGDSLSDFSLALVLGIIIGTYSSNFTATPLAVELERHRPAPPPIPKKSGGNDREDPNYGAVV